MLQYIPDGSPAKRKSKEQDGGTKKKKNKKITDFMK